MPASSTHRPLAAPHVPPSQARNHFFDGIRKFIGITCRARKGGSWVGLAHSPSNPWIT